MAEVKDVRPPAGLGQAGSHGLRHVFGSALHQQPVVHVALHRETPRPLFQQGLQGRARPHAEHRGAAVHHQFGKRTLPHEQDAGQAGLQAGENPLVAGVGMGFIEIPGNLVSHRLEQLHRMHAGLGLEVEVIDGHRGQPVDKSLESSRLFPGHGQCALHAARAFSFDQKSGQGERRARETKQGQFPPQLAQYATDGLGEEAQRIAGLIGSQIPDLPLVPERLGQVGPRCKFKYSPHRRQWGKNILENDYCVHTEPAGQQGYGHGVLRRAEQHLQGKPGAFAVSQVFRVRAAGLAHHPHRGAGDQMSFDGPQQ